MILEGWCVGVLPQSDAELKRPINELERKDDAHGVWRTWVNDQLELFAKNGSYAKAWEDTAGATGQPAPQPPTPDRYAG